MQQFGAEVATRSGGWPPLPILPALLVLRVLRARIQVALLALRVAIVPLALRVPVVNTTSVIISLHELAHVRLRPDRTRILGPPLGGAWVPMRHKHPLEVQDQTIHDGGRN